MLPDLRFVASLPCRCGVPICIARRTSHQVPTGERLVWSQRIRDTRQEQESVIMIEGRVAWRAEIFPFILRS